MKKRILIVDDDAPVRDALKKVLEDAAYEVVAVANGRTAVREFVPGHIDSVILDLNLPDQTGWEVFETLSHEDPGVPFIIITGMGNQYPASAAAGVVALLEKPVEVPALLDTLGELLAESREQRRQRLCSEMFRTRFVPSAADLFQQRLHQRATAAYRIQSSAQRLNLQTLAF